MGFRGCKREDWKVRVQGSRVTKSVIGEQVHEKKRF